jgi:outer membrane protein
VRTAFFQARAQKALVSSSRETLANQERHLSQVQGFVELGTRPEIDLAQARTDLANAKLAVIQAENNYATARAQLNSAMGAMASSEYEVSDDTLAPLAEEEQPLEALVQTAFTTRPELASLAKQIEADQRLVRAAKGGYGPTLGASTAFTDAGQSLDNLGWNWNAAITLTWPLFQGMLVPAQVRETEANLAAAEAARDAVELQLRLEVEQARLAVRGAKASLTASEQVLVNAREQLRLAEGRYRTGVGSIIELSDAQTAVVAAEGQRVNADYLLSSARAQLMQALGRETL